MLHKDVENAMDGVMETKNDIYTHPEGALGEFNMRRIYRKQKGQGKPAGHLPD